MNKVYSYVQKRIVKSLEEAIKNGVSAPWHKPWKSFGMVNYITRKQYRGINRILLPECGEYITYTQICNLKKSNSKIDIIKGAKKYMVVFWKFDNQCDKDKNNIDNIEEDDNGKPPIFRYYFVYNINDVLGLESKFLDRPVTLISDLELEAEKVISNYCIDDGPELLVRTASNRAYYRLSEDRIYVPDKRQFKNVYEYYSTLFHELIHSTGYVSRLNRFEKDGTIFGSESYSKEELVAEIGANMLCNEFGLSNSDSFTNSISYLYGWLKRIKEDTTLIIYASQKAQRAVDFIMNRDNL